MAVLRRTAIGVALIGGGAVALGWWRLRGHPRDPYWQSYKARFFQSEGRIVDTGNGGVSHSEGQGYGMLFAAAYGDRQAFDSLWQWTQKTLARPDGLHSWRYLPGGSPPVADPNNASDGDLLMAWALIRAAKRWPGSDYAKDAHTIATALKSVVVVRGDRTYLLPGIAGFAAEGTRVVNLSYWVFPALRDLARETGDPIWSQVSDTGVALIDGAQFGSRHLPPDWLETAGDLRPAEKFPPRFGYDAVRVPLNLVWGGLATRERLAPIASAWASFPDGAPAWIDLTSDQTSPEKQSAGMRAVAALTASAAQGKIFDESAIPGLDAATDYYSASLLMQTRLCLADTAATHVS